MPPWDAERIQKEMERQQADNVKKQMLEINSHAYGYASTYTALIVFGGYAALFTIWSYTREHLTPFSTYWSALLLGISVLSFVLFEIFKMVIVSKQMMDVSNLLRKSMTPEQFLSEKSKMDQSANTTFFRIVIPIWIVVLTITVATGFLAAIILLSAFASSIAYPSPLPAP